MTTAARIRIRRGRELSKGPETHKICFLVLKRERDTCEGEEPSQVWRNFLPPTTFYSVLGRTGPNILSECLADPWSFVYRTIS